MFHRRISFIQSFLEAVAFQLTMFAFMLLQMLEDLLIRFLFFLIGLFLFILLKQRIQD
jgi:hypothetical protein